MKQNLRYIADVEQVDFNQRYIIRDTFDQYKIIYRGISHDFFDATDDSAHISLLCKLLNEEYNQYEKQVREIASW